MSYRDSFIFLHDALSCYRNKKNSMMEDLQLMKKLMTALLAIVLIISPIGNFVFQDSTVAEAKRYKSGKKGFNPGQSNTPNQSTIKKDKQPDKPAVTNNTKTNKANKGGLMRGLMVGGLAGLLFGSLFANMGMLGSILGFLINALAIVFLFVLIRKVFTMLADKKKNEDKQRWNH